MYNQTFNSRESPAGLNQLIKVQKDKLKYNFFSKPVSRGGQYPPWQAQGGGQGDTDPCPPLCPHLAVCTLENSTFTFLLLQFNGTYVDKLVWELAGGARIEETLMDHSLLKKFMQRIPPLVRVPVPILLFWKNLLRRNAVWCTTKCCHTTDKWFHTKQWTRS